MIENLKGILLITAATGAAAMGVSGCSSTDAVVPENAGSEAGCPASGCPTQGDAGQTQDDASQAQGDAGQAQDDAGPTPVDVNTPPTGKAEDIEAWIAKGDYKKGDWKCDPAPHDAAATGMSPHGKVLICSNKLAQGYTSGTFAVGAATVKELYAANGTTRNGTAIMVKVAAGAAPNSWHWYDRVGANTVANGRSGGNVDTVCVGCHSKAGTAGNTGGDFIFSIIK
jgi:hypothetical protein